MFVLEDIMKTGEEVYMIESNRIIRKVKIIKLVGNFAIVKFEEGGGTQISVNRLYKTKADSEKKLPRNESLISCHNNQMWNGQML